MEAAQALGDDSGGAALRGCGGGLRSESEGQRGAGEHSECCHAGEPALIESELCGGFQRCAASGYR